jgi:hypothetical protein
MTSHLSTLPSSMNIDKRSTSSVVSESVRYLISNAFEPFKRDYRHWPWSQMGTIVVVCIGSYTLYRWLPAPYRRYYMLSTRNFSRQYNDALRFEKEKLFNQLTTLTTREEGRKLQVVEIGAAHGANMAFYPPHCKIDSICDLQSRILYTFCVH